VKNASNYLAYIKALITLNRQVVHYEPISAKEVLAVIATESTDQDRQSEYD